MRQQCQARCGADTRERYTPPLYHQLKSIAHLALGIHGAVRPSVGRPVDQALRDGRRGLPGGSSLPQLLADKRDYRHRHKRLTLTQILRWADAHHARTGRWPTTYSGPVSEAPGENWNTLDVLLRNGGRGLAGGSSLICLLAEARGAHHHLHPVQLSVAQILAWADQYQRRTGRWPRTSTEPVTPGAPVTWRTVDYCLRKGQRGMPGGSSLVRLLVQHGRGELRRAGKRGAPA